MAYIECEAALKRLCSDCGGFCGIPCVDYKRISEIPAADVRPVEHGVWRKIKYRSICRDCSFRGFASWNYCPNCGRQMTMESENE